MDSKVVLKTFNDHFIEFIDDVKCLFPTNKDIIAAYTGLITLRKANPSLICKIWQKKLYNIIVIQLKKVI